MIIFLCAGDHSLHIDNGWSEEFDLWIHYYGEDETIYEKYKESCKFITRGKGSKYENITNLLNQHELWKIYDYIWFPDDDIKINSKDLKRFYEYSVYYDVDISQPSLYDINVSHKSLVNKENWNCEWVDFIEIQMPLFKVSIFDKIIFPFLNENKWNKSGFGFDFWWSDKWIEKYNFKKLLVHEIYAIHTNPVGLSYNKQGFNPTNDFNNLKNIVINH
jgi:hypothetical protein